MGTVRETLAEGTKGAPHLGPERPRVYSDLSPEEKDRYNADIRATNILLQGLPKDIYTLINHYTDAKDIWDNVKMLLDDSELTKEDRGSQLNIKMTMSRMQLNSKFVNNMLPEWGRFMTTNSDYYKDKMLLMQAQENGVALDEEHLLFLVGRQDNVIDEDVDEQHVQDLALNADNVFQADDHDAFDYNVDEAPTAQTMFMVNLSSTDPVYDEAGLSYDSDILSEVHDHDHYQDVVCEYHDEHEMHDNVQLNHVIDSHADYTSDSNMIPYDQYVKDNAVPGVYIVENSLTAELATYKEQVDSNMIPYDQYVKDNVVPGVYSIGYKNPLCLTRAKQVHPALYNGHEIIKDNHVPTLVHDTEDTLEIAKITRRKMNEKMKDPECVNHKVKISPHDYLKKNFLATFTPQKQLTPEKIFWSQDLIKMKTKALKEHTTASRPIKALTVEHKREVEIPDSS
nr:integrase, catalytic region, zinc finger, CCHC-type, peptidase aspartic, catalytic [Tanacetum cinerariifolium]